MHRHDSHAVPESGHPLLNGSPPVSTVSRAIKLIIEYDGTNYCGWQIQPNGITIQEVLEASLAKLLGDTVRLHSSGRTDAGVHAKGMVAVFNTVRPLPLQAFVHGLNALIPPEIAIRSAEEVPPEFNPRTDAVGKLYRYTILNAPTRAPLHRQYSWHLREGLDLALMREAAAAFVGKHDFSAFRAANCAAKSSERTITALDIAPGPEGLIVIDVRGTGFLRNMVRIMVGTLVAVGRGKLDPGAVNRLLVGGDRTHAGATAPPQGLCLMEVYY
jgi:tRNA pseudouridine38-40 synthase